VIANRSIPAATIIPELPYRDVVKASDWLCAAFGFSVRLRIGDHRAQLAYGDGAMIAIERGELSAAPQFVLVRVEDANAHHERALRNGALILRPPEDHPYGERQYTAEDLGGHRWTFSESIADVDPAVWGGQLLGTD
jgi:uncharacterized glyoxalase superfamily protein PhnB